jgi:hypothetical protein
MRRPPKPRFHPDPDRDARSRALRDRALRYRGQSLVDTTQEIAAMAAILIADEGVVDYSFAKRKAVERLGMPERTALPDHQQIEAALAEHWAIFGGADHDALIRSMREVALELMDLLHEYSPRLIGPVLTATASPETEITLQLFPDDAKSVEIFLINHGIEYLADDRQRGDSSHVRLNFEMAEFAVSLSVLKPRELRQPLKSRDGHDLPRANAAELRRLLANPPLDAAS